MNPSQHSFAQLPRTKISRSVFPLHEKNTFTFNEGDIIPFGVMEVLPSSTYKVNVSAFVRSQTPITPVMDDAYLDIQFYFTPNRILWEHWVNLCGENTASSWAPTVEYETPYVTSPEGGFDKDSIADYMGIPTGVKGLEVNVLPFRAYTKVYNEFFRDQNLIDPAFCPFDDDIRVGRRRSEGNPLLNAHLGGSPFKACKLHDYFTSCLPSPQKATDPVQLPPFTFGPDSQYAVTGPLFLQSDADKTAKMVSTPATASYTGHDGTNFQTSTENSMNGTGTLHFPEPGSKRYGETDPVPVSELAHVDLSGPAALTMPSINALREAFALQRLYERDARGGSRYRELLLSHFGAVSPDASLQRPEYLGGKRMRLNMQQVVQTSQTSNTPLGTTAAYSCTQDKDYYFTKSFTEHGYILALAVVRVKHTYQQGLAPMWSRKSRFQYYWPVFANIGEQPVLNKQIFATGTASDDEVFGFQEAWADYRMSVDRVSGEMRSNVANTLDVWHYADDYSKTPVLSAEWIQEGTENIDRTLAVKSTVSDQFFGQMLIYGEKVLPMPVYSVPGLIDHH